MPRKFSGDRYGPWKRDGVHWGTIEMLWGFLVSVMGCHGDVLEVSWYCHGNAFGVSLVILRVSWGAFERLG